MNSMNFVRCLLAAVAGLVISAAGQARTLDEIRQTGKIIIATEGAYPPFNFFQGSRLSGFEVELGEAIAKKMGLGVEWKALKFDALLPGLRQDRWDIVIASFAITEERSRAVTFASPHYCSGGVIISKDPTIRSADSLRDKVVAAQTGSSYLESLKKVPGIREVKHFVQDAEARSALVNGRVDAWVSDFFVVKTAMESNPDAGLKMGRFLFIERIAAAVQKGNSGLAAAYDKALEEVMTDGTYKSISDKYFKADIRCL